MFKILSLLTGLVFLSQLSCQSVSYGPPRSPHTTALAAQKATPDIDPTDAEDKKDPFGKALIIGLAIAVGVGAAIAVPLAVKGKL